MSHPKNMFRLFFLLIIILSACTKKQTFNSNNLEGQVWIYNSDSLPDSIKNFTDNYMIFDNSSVNLNSHNIGDFEIISDTLRIYKISNDHQKGNKFKEKEINQFVGIIIKADSNEILIEKISGFFPISYKNSTGYFDESKVIKLINQKKIKKNKVNLSYVSIASSNCYGTCPAFNLELDNKRNVKFHCKNFCKRIGDYEGVISIDEQMKIEDIISVLNLHNDSTILYPPDDAPRTVLKIKMNNKEYYFSGNSRDFQWKMQELIKALYNICENSTLKRTKEKLKFKANIEVIPPEEIFVFIPPTVK